MEAMALWSWSSSGEGCVWWGGDAVVLYCGREEVCEGGVPGGAVWMILNGGCRACWWGGGGFSSVLSVCGFVCLFPAYFDRECFF